MLIGSLDGPMINGKRNRKGVAYYNGRTLRGAERSGLFSGERLHLAWSEPWHQDRAGWAYGLSEAIYPRFE